MKQRLFSTSIIISTLCCLLSCQQPSSGKTLLQYADSLLEVSPDTALSFLHSLPVEDYSEEEQIYYDLLLTSAMDKNFLSLLACDSLVDAALDYYDKGDGYNRARALFYKERILFSLNMPEEAMANCFEALGEINDYNNREIKLKSMLYEDLGSWYLEQMMNEKALQMFRLACYDDSLIKDKKGMAYPLRNIGYAYSCMNKQDSAVIFFKRALEISSKSKDSLFISNIYSDLSNNIDDMDTALIYAHKAISNLPSHADSASYFISLGEIFQEISNLDSAEFYLKKAMKLGGVKERTLASFSLAEIAKEKKNYQVASDYFSNYIDLIDSIFASNQASNIERLAYKYEAKTDIIKKEKQMQQSAFLIVLTFVLVVSASIIRAQLILRKRKIAQLVYEKEVMSLNDELIIMQSNIEKTEAEIKALRQIQSNNEDEIREKEKLISKMINEKAELRNFIFSKTPIYHLIQKLSQQKRDNKKEIRVLTLKEQDTLRKTMFDIYNEHVDYLRTTYTKINEDDYLYCCLQLCKFDDYTIAYCFGNTDKQIVIQRRYRLKEKMRIE